VPSPLFDGVTCREADGFDVVGKRGRYQRAVEGEIGAVDGRPVLVEQLVEDGFLVLK